MRELTRRALAFQVPHADVLEPGRHAFLDALQAQVSVLVMAKNKIFGKSSEFLKP